MISFQKIYSEFGNSFSRLEKARKRSIYLTAIAWIFFLTFILALTVLIIYNLVYTGASTTVWMDFITWLQSKLPKGFPPQIIIIGFFLITTSSLNLILRKSINNESLFRFTTKKLIKSMAKKVLPDFSFNRQFKITKNEVKDSQLFSYIRNVNQVNINDTISKEYSNTLLKICDLEVYGGLYKRSTSFLMRLPVFNQLLLTFKLLKSISRKQAMTEQLKNESFKGVFAIADFNKKLKGHTIILPDNLEKVIGQFSQSIQKFNFRQGDLVKLEDPEFEKEFVVYSSDQVEARYALSTSMMEKLTRLKRGIDKPIMISFFQNKVYIAIINNNGFFGVDKSQKMDDQLMKGIYLQLTKITSIVEDLDLNRDIWKTI